MGFNPKEAVTGLAETTAREEKRRARDMAAAIEDYESAPEHEKADEAMSLVNTARNTHDRFNTAMLRALTRMLEDGTGKSMQQIIEEATENGVEGVMGALGLAIGPNGEVEQVELVEGEDGELEPDWDSLKNKLANRGDKAAGNPIIEGIDLSGFKSADEVEAEVEAEPPAPEFDVGDRVHTTYAKDQMGDDEEGMGIIVQPLDETERHQVRWTEGPDEGTSTMEYPRNLVLHTDSEGSA